MIDVLAMIVSSTVKASGALVDNLSKPDLLIESRRVFDSAQALKLRRRSRNQSVVPMMEPGPKWNCLKSHCHVQSNQMMREYLLTVSDASMLADME